MRTHYPRTPHLPWSPGVTPDDVRAGGSVRAAPGARSWSPRSSTGRTPPCTRTACTRVRSTRRTIPRGRGSRVSRAGSVARIPAGWRVCGENLYARHSLAYEDLDSWFYGFSVWDGEHCLDWDRTVTLPAGLGDARSRAVLWRGVFDERALRRLRLDTARQEGYVVRTVDGLRAGGLRAVRGQVGARRPRADGHALDVRAGGAERARPGAPRCGRCARARTADVDALLASVDRTRSKRDVARPVARRRADRGVAEAVAEVAGRMDVIGRSGDARLAGRAGRRAARSTPRARLAARLAGPLGHAAGAAGRGPGRAVPGAARPYPGRGAAGRAGADGGRRRPGRAARAGGGRAGGRVDDEAARRVSRSSGRRCTPRRPGCSGRSRWSRCGPVCARPSPASVREAADRCWAEARDACAPGAGSPRPRRRWRRPGGGGRGAFPRLVQLFGPSGSGKSTFAAGLPGWTRTCRWTICATPGARGRTSGPTRTCCARAWTGSTPRWRPGGTVVWDATSLTGSSARWSHAVARRRDALVTHAVALVEEEELHPAQRRRAHPVPPQVLATQLRRFVPPYPGQAHRTWYVGAAGTVEDLDGALDRGRGVMRTSEELYHQVRWDPRFDPARFVLGRRPARAPTPKRIPLPTFVPGGDIPWHRVLFVEADGELVWDRATGRGPDRRLATRAGSATRACCGRPFFTARTPHAWDPARRLAAGCRRRRQPRRRRRPGRAVRLLTWNTLWDRYDAPRIDTARRRPLLLADLAAADADVIALQEVEPALLAHAAGGAVGAGRLHRRHRPGRRDVADSGLLVLSRLPVREAGLAPARPAQGGRRRHGGHRARPARRRRHPPDQRPHRRRRGAAAGRTGPDRRGAGRRRGRRWSLLGDFNDGARRTGRAALGLRDAWTRGARARRRDADLRPGVPIRWRRSARCRGGPPGWTGSCWRAAGPRVTAGGAARRHARPGRAVRLRPLRGGGRPGRRGRRAPARRVLDVPPTARTAVAWMPPERAVAGAPGAPPGARPAGPTAGRRTSTCCSASYRSPAFEEAAPLLAAAAAGRGRSPHGWRACTASSTARTRPSGSTRRRPAIPPMGPPASRRCTSASPAVRAAPRASSRT